ncbi:MAG TPA: hypothetical protein VK453_00445 [Micromonosporaceae bacterium]|nr:hypothetical protein [Micromonosporaceae bacterium]
MAETYVDQLVLELRMRELPGARIGEVVAEVEAHVAESGDDPADAFGSPREYAERVINAVAVVRPAGKSWWSRLKLVGVGVGALLFMDGVVGLIEGGEATLTPGKLISAAVIPIAAVIVLRAVARPPDGPETRLARTTRQWLIPIGCLVAFYGILGGLSFLDEPVLGRYPSWLALLVGATLIVPLLIVPIASHRDAVIDPRTGRDRYGRPWLIFAIMVGILALEVGVFALVVAFTGDGG